MCLIRNFRVGRKYCPQGAAGVRSPIHELSTSKETIKETTLRSVVYMSWTILPRHLWKCGLWSFQTGGTKLKIFLPRIQHTQRKLLNFEKWVNGKVSKVLKFDFLCQKFSESFSISISLKNVNLGSHLWLLTFLVNISF